MPSLYTELWQGFAGGGGMQAHSIYIDSILVWFQASAGCLEMNSPQMAGCCELVHSLLKVIRKDS